MNRIGGDSPQKSWEEKEKGGELLRWGSRRRRVSLRARERRIPWRPANENRKANMPGFVQGKRKNRALMRGSGESVTASPIIRYVVGEILRERKRQPSPLSQKKKAICLSGKRNSIL